MVKNLPPNAGDLRSISGWGTTIPQAAEQLRAHSLTRGFSCSSAGKEFACKAGDAGSIHGLGIFPGRIPWTEKPGRLHTVHGATTRESMGFSTVHGATTQSLN